MGTAVAAASTRQMSPETPLGITPSLLDTGASSASLSSFQDPFIPDGIRSIRLCIRRPYFRQTGQIVFEARVEFESGNTKGEHSIEARSFDELISLTKAFLGEIRK